MHLFPDKQPGENRNADEGHDAGVHRSGSKRVRRDRNQFSSGIEAAVRGEEHRAQFLGLEHWMPPRSACGVVPVEVRFCDPTVAQEVVVLLSAGNRREYVEGSTIRSNADENLEMFFQGFESVAGEAE